MAFHGIGNETYIYLNGIAPRQNIIIGDGITLKPASCDPDPDNIIKKSKSEIDIGVACIFLRTVTSCFHITAESPKELAIKAWNSQWDALALSAIYGCEIAWNFQADVPPEAFVNSKHFEVTNYSLRGLPREKPKIIGTTEQKWLSDNFGKMKTLMNNDQYQNAIHSLSTYKWHSHPRAQLALLWSGIEGLFGIDYELSFRLSLYIARFLYAKPSQRQKQLFENVKQLYRTRSKAVHGGKIKASQDALTETVQILRQLIIKCAEINSTL